MNTKKSIQMLEVGQKFLSKSVVHTFLYWDVDTLEDRIKDLKHSLRKILVMHMKFCSQLL